MYLLLLFRTVFCIGCLMGLPVSRLYSLRWQDDRRIGKNLKKGHHSRAVILSSHLPWGTEENHKKPQSWYPVYRPRFEVRTSEIQVYSITSRPTCSVSEKLFTINNIYALTCCRSLMQAEISIKSIKLFGGWNEIYLVKFIIHHRTVPTNTGFFLWNTGSTISPYKLSTCMQNPTH
jgi:hypothetical protein